MERNIMELLYELKKKFMINDGAFMKEAELTPSEYYTFIAIGDCDMLKSDLLAEKTGLSLSRISRVIDKMVVRGYLDRFPNSNDRRAITLELTRDGHELLQKILRFRKNCESQIVQNVSDEELEQIKQGLNTVLKLI
ncbi:MAG: MarR family transcriptional regulator [Bacteroidota bacterium]